jgi:hypothetical protein
MVDEKATRNWIVTHLRQYEDVSNMYRDQHEDEAMEEEECGTE